MSQLQSCHIPTAVTVAFLFALSGCATATKFLEAKGPGPLTREHFMNTATLKDDALETVATITTYKGYQQRRGLLGIVSNDNFLRAFINKKTGTKTFQLYQVIQYQSNGWNFFQTVNYETPSGPESKPATIIDRNVDSCSQYVGCHYTEQVGFDLEEPFLRDLAAKYKADQPEVWRFKFKAKSGADYNDAISIAEVAGFVDMLDMYGRSKNSIPAGQ